MAECLLDFQDVHRRFPTGTQGERSVLQGVTFDLNRGQSLAMVGRSGSGKSTLLHLAAGIDRPTSGVIRLDGIALNDCDESTRALLRRDRVGLVFQFFHLLPHLSVRDNVCLPGWIAGDQTAATAARASELLDAVELSDHADDRAGRLSGGEMQRVALCRALLRRPALVLADEPTGNLDERAGALIMDLLIGLCRDHGAGLLYVTHSREQADLADSAQRLRDGRLMAEGALA